MQALAGERLDGHDLARVAHPRRLPCGEPTSTGGQQQRVVAVELVVELGSERALAGDHVDVVEGMHHQRAAAQLAAARSGLGVVVQPLDDVHGGPERGDPISFHRRAR